jgi:hypothetical protein
LDNWNEFHIIYKNKRAMSIIDKIINGKYTNNQASSFWMDDFDTDFKRESGVDYTKLAATQRAIGNFVNIVTGKQIPVVFQSSDSSYTDGYRVVIGTKLDGDNFDPAVGLALHEGSHIALTNFDIFKRPDGGHAYSLNQTQLAERVMMRGLDPDMQMTDEDYAIIKDLLNWIEDRRIDFHIYTTAPGYRMYYEAMYDKYFNDKVIDKALKKNEKTQETLDDYLFHIINFTNPNRNLAALERLREVWNLIDLKNIDRLKSTRDALDVAIDAYVIINKAVQEAEQQQKAQMDAAGTGGPDSSDSDEGNESGTGNGTSDDSDNDVSIKINTETSEEEGDNGTPTTQTQSQLSEREQKQLEKAIEQQRKFVNGTLKKTGKLTKAQASTVNAIREAGTETVQVATGAGDTDIVDAIVIKKFTPGIVAAMPSLFEPFSSDYINGDRNYDEALLKDSYYVRSIRENDNAVLRGIVLGKQLGKKLQLRNADRTLKSTRLETGKIDRRLISQLGYDNANVFHRIVTDRFKNYFIHISIDASGSMDGTKFRNALTSALAVAQAASMTTGIRVQISLRGTHTFDNNGERAVTIYAYDSAKDKMNKIRTMFRYLDVFGCTPEGIAFKSIEKYIKADAKGDECIFVNYSDGEPTSVRGTGHYYNGVDFTRRVVNGFRENGINVVSYFIQDGYTYESTRDNFRKMYGPDAQFINPESMTEVSKTLNKKFLEIAL